MMTEISVETALTAFLADRREHSSQRQLRTAEKVITSLRHSIVKDADQPTGDIPASQVTGHIAHLVTLVIEVLPHEEFAASELTTARRVLLSLLRWFGDRGHLDAGAVTAAIADISERLDERAGVKKGVDALGSCVSQVSRDVLAAVPYGDRIEDRTMYVEDVDGESVTFVDESAHYARLAYHGAPEPPRVRVAVPPEVAEVIETVWTILLSAARINGQWCLLNVVSGDP
jgi:hypothetical protein